MHQKAVNKARKIATYGDVSVNIVIRNGKIVWQHESNRPFFSCNLISENPENPVHASLHEMKIKNVRKTLKKFKLKGLS